MAFEVTVEDIKKLYFGANSFPEEDIASIEHIRDLVVAKLKQLLKENGRKLEEDLENDDLDPVLVKNVVASVVKRTYDQATINPAFSEFTQISQSSGPYSFNASPAKKEWSIYFRKEEKRDLGLNTGVKMSVFLPY